MSGFNRLSRWRVLLFCGLAIVVSVSRSHGFDGLRKRVCNRCGVPNGGYGHDDESRLARVIASADPELVGGRKRFHLPVIQINADAVTLDRIGIALYGTGEIVATGTLTHSGGEKGDLLSGRAIVRVRAIAATVKENAPLTDAAVLWQTEKHYRVSKASPQTVSLVPAGHSSKIPASAFGEITHLEVELEYRRDR